MFHACHEKPHRAISMKNKSRPAHTGKKKGGYYAGDWHVSNESMGMGDHYGTGTRQPLARMRDGTGMKQLSKKKLKTPPRTVV